MIESFMNDVVQKLLEICKLKIIMRLYIIVKCMFENFVQVPLNRHTIDQNMNIYHYLDIYIHVLAVALYLHVSHKSTRFLFFIYVVLFFRLPIYCM